MAKLIYKNEMGQSLAFGDKAPFLITAIEGLGSPKNEINRDKFPHQDGTTITSTTLDERELVLEGVILDNSRRNRQKYRNKLIKVFNPKSRGELTFKRDGETKKTKCIPELAPFFPSNMQENYQLFSIQLICPNPYWQDIKETEINLVSWIPNLEFIEGEGFYTEQSPNYWLETGEPFEEFQSEFGTGEGVEFGYREINQIVEIENTGDVDSPIKVVFRAIGDVVNPYIQNMETKEQLRINKTLKQGDKLEITTGFGNKNIYLNGEKAHHYLDFLNSTWLQLSPGTNLIKYDAEHGLNNLECTIYYTPQYLGV